MNKNLFDFKLSTTSFIYPDNIIPNVKKLGSVFDEIELLIFESMPLKVLPSVQEIQELKYLADEFGLTYNVHLPVDISLTAVSKSQRDQAVEIILNVLDLVSPLDVTTHTLHLEYQGINIGIDKDWYKRGFDAMGKLVQSMEKPDIISLETLDYPFELVEPIIDKYDLSVCVDAGHLIKYGYSIKSIFEKYHDKIPLIHLHGVDFSKTPPRDHVSLDKTPGDKLVDTFEVLKKFHGVVSLEVFNKKDLVSSLAWLDTLFS